MNPLQNVVIAGACALGVAALASPANAASGTSSGATVGGYSMKDIQTVGHRGGGGGWGGGGRGFGGGHGFGGGRSFGGGRGFGGGHGFSGGRWGGRGWNGGGRYAWGGGGYRGWRGGYRGGYYRGWRGYGYRHGYGGYYAAGILGLGVGAALASPYYYDDYYDRPGYYDDGYAYAPRRVYSGAECQVISKRRDARGRLVRVVRYRPC